MVTVRPAAEADLDSLVELRLANAAAHLALDPQAYRLPERGAVRRHFAGVLSDPSGRDALLVAEDAAGAVVGMVEVLRNPPPPEHQILRPVPAAQIHTVVLDGTRGQGIGAALVTAATNWAAEQGIRYLTAGIHHRNAGAVRFYERHGFAGSGRSLARQL